MNLEERNGQTGAAQADGPADAGVEAEVEAQVASALRHFRQSVHGWSEREYAKPRPVVLPRRKSFQLPLAGAGLRWTLATALLLVMVGIPAGLVRDHLRQAADTAARQANAMERPAEPASPKLAVGTAPKAADKAHANRLSAGPRPAPSRTLAGDDDFMNDDFMNDLDSDIAQATPQAMQPLASLMYDARTR